MKLFTLKDGVLFINGETAYIFWERFGVPKEVFCDFVNDWWKTLSDTEKELAVNYCK